MLLSIVAIIPDIVNGTGFLRKPATIGRIDLPSFNFILECFNHVFDYIEKITKVKSRVEIHPLPKGRGILSTTSDKRIKLTKDEISRLTLEEKLNYIPILEMNSI
jgi:hypothetical protein